jgi:hypothetical protein
MEGTMALKTTSEKGQSITLFALMLPLMAMFILGLFDYMVTSARTMEAVAVADLSAHAGHRKFIYCLMEKYYPMFPQQKGSLLIIFECRLPHMCSL